MCLAHVVGELVDLPGIVKCGQVVQSVHVPTPELEGVGVVPVEVACSLDQVPEVGAWDILDLAQEGVDVVRDGDRIHHDWDDAVADRSSHESPLGLVEDKPRRQWEDSAEGHEETILNQGAALIRRNGMGGTGDVPRRMANRLRRKMVAMDPKGEKHWEISSDQERKQPVADAIVPGNGIEVVAVHDYTKSLRKTGTPDVFGPATDRNHLGVAGSLAEQLADVDVIAEESSGDVKERRVGDHC